jgi:hypothetical protein
MKRSARLAPLSRDHHVALWHALRLRRATGDDLTDVVGAFLGYLQGPGLRHFAEEEQLAPEVPDTAMAARMLDEHDEILRRAERLGEDPGVADARALGELLAGHVRFEERELFPLLETAP